MKVAVVCDWLVVFLLDNERGFIKNKTTHTTFIQNLPSAKKHYRSYLLFMPIALLNSWMLLVMI